MKSIALKKNLPKFNAYRMSFDMIKCALERDCPLQAIAVEESILTDRLSSTMNVCKPHAQPKDTLGRVLTEWHPQKPSASRNANASLFDEEMELLFPKLSAWWRMRNELLHGIAKSAQGEGPSGSVDDFMADARSAAKKGYALVRKVDAWTKKQIKAARKRAQN